MSKVKLMLGDNMKSLKELPDNSIDSVVCDSPYGLSFMGKKWDYDVPTKELWEEVYRVLKPGGHLLSFGGTRTYHRMVVNIEDAGFEIRDQIQWITGQGFPKSHNIGKAYDKKMGNITKGNSKYEGQGTALKPANEPICLARKPLSEKTIVDNVIKWGTGGLNIDGCRIGSDVIKSQMGTKNKDNKDSIYGYYEKQNEPTFNEGRFPANIILDEEAGRLLDEQSGIKKSSKRGSKYNKDNTYSDKGGASRFFYSPKVSKKERNMGLDSFEETTDNSKGNGFG